MNAFDDMNVVIMSRTENPVVAEPSAGGGHRARVRQRLDPPQHKARPLAIDAGLRLGAAGELLGQVHRVLEREAWRCPASRTSRGPVASTG